MPGPGRASEGAALAGFETLWKKDKAWSLPCPGLGPDQNFLGNRGVYVCVCMCVGGGSGGGGGQGEGAE